ncbi:MAG: hypothetical protein H0W50_04380 [Parachlamydiaceae bacterium]|nr:hypothetical protein [Parachlamydiaceae bacterium]
MNINNLQTLAKEFSLFVEKELEGLNEDDLKSRVHWLKKLCNARQQKIPSPHATN